MLSGDTLADNTSVLVHKHLRLLSRCVHASLGKADEARSLCDLSSYLVESFSKHL
jgi:hypothetical protein